MSQHEPFKYKTIEDLLHKAGELGLDIPFRDSIDPLFEPGIIGLKTVPNRFAVQPMEGFDSNPDGSPGEFTFRRYGRYAGGGNGLIWFEATSVVRQGRSNPRQLMLNDETLDGFKRLVDYTRKSARDVMGVSYDPYLVIQITHSGRYSKPDGRRVNKVACYNPFLDGQQDDVGIISDEELDRLKDIFIHAVHLSHEAGFDAVDIKACHGYLIHELLGAHTRQESRYGGSFTNRSRFLVDVVDRSIREVPEIVTAVRLNATDGIPYPYGFGVKEDGSVKIDLKEPMDLSKQLIDAGCSLLNITAGIPYHSPHYVRPFNRPVTSADFPREHPLEGVMRLLKISGLVQKEFPQTPVVGTGYSYLRHFYPQVGSAVLCKGMASSGWVRILDTRTIRLR